MATETRTRPRVEYVERVEYGEPRYRSKASFSVPSILALVCAIASFPLGAVLGAILAVAAIVFGVVGAAMALSPRVRGGVVSVISILAGLAGIVAAAVKLVLLFF